MAPEDPTLSMTLQERGAPRPILMDHFYQLVMLSERSIQDWIAAEAENPHADPIRLRALADSYSYILNHVQRKGSLKAI